MESKEAILEKWVKKSGVPVVAYREMYAAMSEYARQVAGAAYDAGYDRAQAILGIIKTKTKTKPEYLKTLNNG